MKEQDEKVLQLNEEHVNNSKANHKEETNMKRRTMVMVAMVMMVMVMAGCTRGDQQPAPVVATVEPTKEATPTEVVAEPTKEAAPTEVVAEPTPEAAPTEVVEDNPNIIEGVDFTSFNEEYMVIDVAMHDMHFDVPRIVVTQSTDTEQRAVAILSNGDSFVQEEGKYVYYLYAPKPVKAVSYNEKMIELNVNGTITEDNHVYEVEIEGREVKGEMYPTTYGFWIQRDGTVTDDSVVIMIDYEDGTADTIAVFITKDYIG